MKGDPMRSLLSRLALLAAVGVVLAITGCEYQVVHGRPLAASPR